MASRWYTLIWRQLDETLQEWNQALTKALRKLRLAVALYTLAAGGAIAMGICMFIWPQHVAIFAGVAVILLSLGVISWASLLALPLKAKSVTKLIEKGYPANIKEMAIRVAARKLHEESIETEELLVETALNESRKLVRRFKDRSKRMDELLREEE